MNALRLFYGDLNWTTDDFPKVGAKDEDVWIEVEFILDEIEWENLADNYKNDDNKNNNKDDNKNDSSNNGSDNNNSNNNSYCASYVHR